MPERQRLSEGQRVFRGFFNTEEDRGTEDTEVFLYEKRRFQRMRGSLISEKSTKPRFQAIICTIVYNMSENLKKGKNVSNSPFH